MSTARPRSYIREDSHGKLLDLTRCPFCDEPMSGEPQFRDHLHKFCTEAPREVVHQ